MSEGVSAVLFFFMTQSPVGMASRMPQKMLLEKSCMVISMGVSEESCVGVYEESLVDKAEINVVGRCRQQGRKYIHQGGEYPRMRETDAASANPVAVVLCIIIAYKRASYHKTYE